MSVLIKGMEMPKNCGECQFCHTENFTTYCCPTGREDIFYDEIPEWCPLEEPKTGEWIPCAERLPDMNKKVLCACIANIYEVLELRAIGWFHDNAHIYMKGFVLAWMPLPEPYKKEGEDK